jgi:hypothetical protein
MPTPNRGRGRDALRSFARILGFITIVMCILGTPKAFAQGAGTSTITGTVGDSSGVIPGALVTLTETGTGVARTSTSNETGVFRFVALPPGQYTVKVTLQNFKPVTVEAFVVDASSRATSKRRSK